MKIKALSKIAVLQWTPGSSWGGIPLLGTLFPIAKGSEWLWVHPPPLGRLAAPGEGAGWLHSVYFLGSWAWLSGMNLVFILRKFIFDSGRAGEDVNDRKRREGSEILWGCPHNTTSGPLPRQQADETKLQNATCQLLFLFFPQSSQMTKPKPSPYSIADLCGPWKNVN